METLTLKIDGMSCGHCKKALETAIAQLDGVDSVRVDLDTNTATIEVEKGELLEKIKQTVVEAGYTPR